MAFYTTVFADDLKVDAPDFVERYVVGVPWGEADRYLVDACFGQAAR